MKFLNTYEKVAALQVAATPVHNQVGQKAYWFYTQKIIRTSGLLPFLVLSINRLKKNQTLGPRHQMLVELVSSTENKTKTQLLADIVAAEVTIIEKGKALELCSIFEMYAEGERTDDIIIDINART